MMISDLQRMADRLSDLIKKPVEVEMDNCGGYDLVLWIDGKDAEQPGICSCFDDECMMEDYEPRTAADDCYNTLHTLIGFAEWLKRNGMLKTEAEE